MDQIIFGLSIQANWIKKNDTDENRRWKVVRLCCNRVDESRENIEMTPWNEIWDWENKNNEITNSNKWFRQIKRWIYKKLFKHYFYDRLEEADQKKRRSNNLLSRLRISIDEEKKQWYQVKMKTMQNWSILFFSKRYQRFVHFICRQCILCSWHTQMIYEYTLL